MLAHGQLTIKTVSGFVCSVSSYCMPKTNRWITSVAQLFMCYVKRSSYHMTVRSTLSTDQLWESLWSESRSLVLSEEEYRSLSL